MTKKVKYQFYTQIIFIMVLGILVFKPIYHLVNHLNDDEDIELCEDSSEEEQKDNDGCEDEIEFYFTQHNIDISVFKSINNQSFCFSPTDYFEVYRDILIPPPRKA